MKKHLSIFGLCLFTGLYLNAQTNLYPPSGNVGIGTTETSNGVLTINGDSPSTLRLENDANNKEASIRFRVRNNLGTTSHMDLSSYYGNTNGFIGFKTPYNNTPGQGYKFIVNNLGNVGVGTTNPLAKLDILSPATPFEKFLNLKTNDATNDYFTIVNATGANGQFIPSLTGYHTSDNRQALYLNGSIGEVNDTGNQPIMVFDSRVTNKIVATRPLFAWDSFGNRKMILNAQGNLGIGTTDPQYKLDVNGTVGGSLQHSNGYFTMYPYSSGYDDGSYVKAFYDGKNKQINFWNSDNGTGYTRLQTGGLTISSANPTPSSSGFANKIEFKGGGHGAIVLNPGASNELMFGMHGNGNFYWGTGRSATKKDFYSMFLNGNTGDLGIRGKLTSNEVKVKIGGWADFVFKDDYNLPTLKNVEQHIKEKGHLKDIPSADEVSKNGILLGDMNAKLLQKIEELTLYTINQEKEIRASREELQSQKKINKDLENRLKKIESFLNSKK